MPKKQKSHNNDPVKNLAVENFGPTLSEGATQKKKSKPMNTTAKRTKWNPFPVEIKTTTNATNQSNSQKAARNRRRRKYKDIEGSRSRKPASPSLVSNCSSNSIISSSSGLGSLGSSALTTLNGTHDSVSTPTLPSSGCSSIGFSDDKYEDTRFNDLLSERDSEIAAEEENESGAETLNDSDLTAAVSVGLFTENFVKPDLTNPTVQQFYQEQRIIYRQFYERQFSAICLEDATYCALSSQLAARCNIQGQRQQRPAKYPKNIQKQDQNRKPRNSCQSEMKSRVFYNSSTRLDNLKPNVDTKPSSQKSEQNSEPSCSIEEENGEEGVDNSEEQENWPTTVKNNNQPNKKEHTRKREESSNYNTTNNGHKKRYEQKPYKSNHQSDKDKKAEVDLKKLIARLDPLSSQIYEFQKSTEQTASSLCEKLYLRDLLYCNIAPHFTGCGLYIVGSTLNGFSCGASDMDLCLMISPRELDQRIDSIFVLTNIMRCLQAIPLINKMELIFAKVPILRATFHAPFDKITIDLNVNMQTAIRNTHLLCYYSGFDWRVRPMVCAIKEWAKRRGINNANQSSLTSYSLVLMAIHYLQCGVSPPILPSLQNCFPARFGSRLDVRTLDISYPLETARNWEYGKNTMSLGDLLKGFFHYYAYDFDFDTSAISVRLGKKVERAFVVSQHRSQNLAQWRCICIEEPFTLSNAAHSVFDERVFAAIKNSFELAYESLDRDTNLESLLDTEPIQPSDLIIVNSIHSCP